MHGCPAQGICQTQDFFRGQPYGDKTKKSSKVKYHVSVPRHKEDDQCPRDPETQDKTTQTSQLRVALGLAKNNQAKVELKELCKHETLSYPIVMNSVLGNRSVQHSLVPILKTLWLGSFLLRWMAMKDVVIALSWGTCPYVSRCETVQREKKKNDILLPTEEDNSYENFVKLPHAL